ncbi:MAG TPA: ATP-binding protein [Alphaproteobacteria bacterium]|nr:ATP-binding protein [Alphaproteobacteria bacterium]
MLKIRNHQDFHVYNLWKIVHNKWASRQNDTLGEVLNSLEMALVYFNPDGTLKTANCRACELIPQLSGRQEERSGDCHNCKVADLCQNNEKPIKTFNELIAYVFDNSLDVAEQSGLFLESENTDATIFREIIKLSNEKFYLVRAVPQKNKETIVELTDISAIKSRADYLFKLGHQNKILTEAVQTIRKGIFIAENKTQEKEFLFVNQAMDHLLQMDCQDYIGKPVFEFFEAAFQGEYEQIKDVLAGKNTKNQIWHIVQDKQGNTVWLELTMFHSGQNGHLLIGFVSDETQNKLQENRLLQTQKLEAIGHMAGGISHDFNNILAIIEGYARIAKTTWKKGEDISPHLDKIYQATQRGSGLTRQLLTFGKHRVSEDKVIDLCRHVEDVKNLLIPLLGVNVKLDMKLEEGNHYIKGTPDIITQIVMNLSINARDAMQDKGTITIEVLSQYREDKENGFLLRIADTGCGMSQEIMERMFDPFFTTKEQGKGTGLGLSMVYGLVQQMKGDMLVDSEVGQGTTFSIWFPESEAPVQEEDNKPDLSQDQFLYNKTVLLAEDEPDLLEIMKGTLEEFGMNVLTSLNGNQALEVQDEYDGKIDFLLTDMVMPEIGGIQLAELFHVVRPDTHIIFMSGYPVRGEISEVDLPDDVIFLAKPVSQENLKNVMEQVYLGKNVETPSGVVWE